MAFGDFTAEWNDLLFLKVFYVECYVATNILWPFSRKTLASQSQKQSNIFPHCQASSFFRTLAMVWNKKWSDTLTLTIITSLLVSKQRQCFPFSVNQNILSSFFLKCCVDICLNYLLPAWCYTSYNEMNYISCWFLVINRCNIC